MKKEEGLRIDHENMLMLNRLVKGKSTFSVDKWESQHRKRQKLLKNFGLYPYILNKKGADDEVSVAYKS